MDSELTQDRTLTKVTECAMEIMELEAAEALAGLAHYSSVDERGRENTIVESVSEQVSNEFTAVTAGMTNPDDSLASSSHLDEEQAAVFQELCEKELKVEQEAELSKHSLACTQSYESSGRNKSRQNLSEAEKEVQRLRRVLANRESARKTIRHRQALYEEFTRKVADLARENENLKREKELAAKEYDSLKSINEYLRAKMAEVVKAGTDESLEESNMNHLETSRFTSTNGPFFIYNQPPFTPLFWPSIANSSNSLRFHCGHQNGTGTPPQVPMPAIAKSDSLHDQKNSITVNHLGTPLYILPCPWFFPIPSDASRFHSQPFDSQPFDMSDKQNKTSVNNQCGSSTSSKATTHIDSHTSPIPVKGKTEASDTLPEHYEEPTISQSEKLVYVATAAEVRKRRKNLTKLKKLHCCRFQMHC